MTLTRRLACGGTEEVFYIILDLVLAGKSCTEPYMARAMRAVCEAGSS